jgi:hypothetical protein
MRVIRCAYNARYILGVTPLLDGADRKAHHSQRETNKKKPAPTNHFCCPTPEHRALLPKRLCVHRPHQEPALRGRQRQKQRQRQGQRQRLGLKGPAQRPAVLRERGPAQTTPFNTHSHHIQTAVSKENTKHKRNSTQRTKKAHT